VNTKTKMMTRRRVLRGVVDGAVVSVGLPFLDCFLDSHGSALAATGAPLPVCFGIWWQGLGLTPGRWLPDTVGAGYENKIELKVLDPFRSRTNIISGTKYFLDGKPLETHLTGWQIASIGTIPSGAESGPSLDSNIADVVGTKTRFRSLEVSVGGTTESFSKRAGSGSNPSEPSPIALYARIFGPDFKDPNAADFKPDPMVLARRSVLSVVQDERKSLMRQLDASDRARLDEYFTSVRQIEQQLDLEAQKPAPMPACSLPERPPQGMKSLASLNEAAATSRLMGALLTHALACGQTRVFNVMIGSMGFTLPGTSETWHELTHEEPVDPKLGYQIQVTEFLTRTLQMFADFLHQLESTREGNGSVLDRVVVLWQSDHGYAATHTMDNLPFLTVGTAGGRLKGGMHVSAPGDPAARVGLTLQQVMGVPIGSWGALSNETSKTIREILV
jgi:hypothetical protein